MNWNTATEESSTTTTLFDDAFFEALRKEEFSRLDETGQTYLDYTGGNLYGVSQLQKHMEIMQRNVMGNPHSTNPSSQYATKLVEGARKRVLDFFNAGEDYYCIFTSNASGALQIVGECYPFQDKGYFMLLADNHNSVNGIREYCRERGGDFEYVRIKAEDLTIQPEELEESLTAHDDKKNKLFAFPAQSNVSGVKHDLNWVAKAKAKGWDVLLDAAAFVPTSKLDLKKIQPDFVSVSFYKIFGHPTGIGCLLLHKSKFEKLKKHWFAGGTVTVVSVVEPKHFLANNHERFENGTVDYLNIPAISIGLDFIENIGIDRINKRISSLTSFLIHQLNELHHSNGKPLLKIFGPGESAQRGASIVLNFFDEDGKKFDYEFIEAEANKHLISIRSGCFCNPGIDEINNCLTNEEISRFFTSNPQVTSTKEFLDFVGKMRGATRVSVGMSTVKRDLEKFLDFAKSLIDTKA
ncbi:MAG: aminotransferase class V-fold PLP-dependent enzyme [Saprospiraceae bacterium]|nr:aminotransferase class V-fold PLP-dependent enzyme [Saprospiraceae bacterium]